MQADVRRLIWTHVFERILCYQMNACVDTNGLSETPLHFISRYKGDSVGRYRRYPM